MITGVQTLRASSGKQMVIAERKTSYIKKKKEKVSYKKASCNSEHWGLVQGPRTNPVFVGALGQL